jgi:transposase
MIGYETYCQMRLLTQQGLNASQIADTCALDERTVRYWQGQGTYRARKKVQRASKLDPFQDLLVRWLAEYPYSSVQLLRKVREAGYTGGYSILKERVLQLRPPRRPAYLSLAFEPGECAQVDWGCAGTLGVGNTNRRLSFFVMVLCYSAPGRIRRISTACWKANASVVKSTALPGASKMPVSRSPRRWKASTGTGPRRSTGPKSKTSSAWPSWRIMPT